VTISRRFKAGCLFTLFAGLCVGIGFVLGILAQQTWKKKTEEPKIVKWAAMKHLEKLKPTEEQKRVFEPRIDAAIVELETYKAEAMRGVWDLIDRVVADIDAELTPEQKVKWGEIRPKRPPE
jgi:hypothetical protein